jgi:hypothetical protein
MLNTFHVVGEIVRAEVRKTGAAMIWVRSSEREDGEIQGAPVPSFFTSVLAIRVPRYVIEKLPEDLLEKGNTVSVSGRLQGVRRVVEGRDFYLVEAQAGIIS